MKRERREVVITGVGLCCHMGDDLERIMTDLRAGKNTPFQPYEDAVRYNGRCQIIGTYPEELVPETLGVGKAEARFMGRASWLALKAARQALDQSGIDPEPLAVAVGSGTGDVETHIEIAEKLRETANMRRVSATVIPKLMASTVSANLVNALKTKGPSFTVTAACAGGNYNIAIAASFIESGLVDGALAGGVEVMDPHFFAGFDSMRAYNGSDNENPGRASRPYAADRAGFIFSEGSGIVVLEERESARKRGATILGVVRGYGMTSDGVGEMVAPSPEGAEMAMRKALADAGVSPEEIDYVNTHGTSTPLGDLSEIQAMRRVFGERRVLYSSTKGYTGHPVSAAGAIEAIFTLEMMRGGFVVPSVNASPLDPALEEYPPVLEPRDVRIETALSNSFGFGGTNACIVLGAPSTS